jgi:aminoglycoside phosphotransferase (APT) family kinase protein
VPGLSRMHADEVAIDAALVRRLLNGQFPHWSALPLEPVPSAGTDNALFRLGSELVVRLPRIDWAVPAVDKEQHWLPRLAPHLPAAVPLPIGHGEPAAGYPWPWSVYRWLDGESPDPDHLDDAEGLAAELAGFVAALHRIHPTGGPPAVRGVPLAERDEDTRAAIDSLAEMVDTAAVTAAWEEDLHAPAWTGPPVWVHGDLSPGNLLLVDGRLAAVIDFGGLGVGDPACDLIVGWNLLPADGRDAFRSVLQVDDATWQRGRGWALSIALIQLPYYHRTNPQLAASARHVIREVLAAHSAGPRR